MSASLSRSNEGLFVDSWEGRLGSYTLRSSVRGVVGVEPATAAPSKATVGHPYNAQAALELEEFFAGERRSFSLPLDARGTLFQRTVWAALLDIPYGETRSYAQIAAIIGRPKSARAVGRAIGSNPIAIMVPCHRVVGSDGSLTGYAGGLKRKKALLELEAKSRAAAGSA